MTRDKVMRDEAMRDELERPGLREARRAARLALLSGAWLPTAVFLLHVFLSRIVFLYRGYPATDIPMHALGGYAIAFFWERVLAASVRQRVVRAPDRILGTVLVFALVATATVVWELAEFLGDAAGVTHAQAGLGDTMLDMALGLVGGIVYLKLGPRARGASTSCEAGEEEAG